MQYDYIIYHKNCLDGFTSLIILLKSKMNANDAIIYHDVPSTDRVPKMIDNKNVIIMDVAYKYHVLKNIFERAKSVVFIDHHITIKNDVQKLHKLFPDKTTIIYDINGCGASLTWKFFFKSEPMPYFIKYIKDNDTGTWRLKNTHAFIYALRTKYNIEDKKETILKWFSLFDNDVVKKLIKLGRKYKEYADALLIENSKKYTLEAFPSELIYAKFSKHFEKPGQYKVCLICGSGCPNSTMLGNYILDTIECDFVLFWTYNFESKKYVLIFRSKIVPVNYIAELFGGGGHEFACACSFSAEDYNITDLFFLNSLPRIKS